MLSRVIAVCLLGVLAFSRPALALTITNPAATYGCERPLRLAYFRFGALYDTREDGGAFGVDVDLVTEMAKRSGCQFTTTELSRVLIWKSLQNDQTDIGTGGVPTAERETYLQFMPYLVSRNSFVMPAAYVGRVKSLEDFISDDGLMFGVVKSFVHGEPYDAFIAQLRAKGRVLEASDVEQLFRWLQIGRVQGAVAHPIVGYHLIDKFHLAAQLTVLDWAKAYPAVNGGLMFSRKRFSPTQRTNWDALIRDMRRDGTVERIYTKYVDAKTAAALTPPP